MIKFIKKFFYDHKKLSISFLIFFTVFLFFVIAGRKWIFAYEDFCNLLNISKVKTCTDFLNLLLYSNVNDRTHFFLDPAITYDFSCNFGATFFQVYYRPMIWFMHVILFPVFGLNAYCYYLFIMFFHAFISALLFYIFTFFVSTSTAVLAAYLFAFHSSFFTWLGAINTMQHQLCLLFFVLVFMLLRKAFVNKEKNTLIILFAGLLYFICLLSRETYFILPLIVLLSFPFLYKIDKRGIWLFFLKIMVMMGVVLGCYTLLRHYAYPLDFGKILEIGAGSSFSFKHFFVNIFDSIANIVYNLYCRLISLFLFHKFYFFCLGHNIVWFYKIIKNTLVAVVFLLFVTNKKKALTAFLFFAFWLTLWPSYFGAGGLRYFCDGLPFAILAIALMIDYSSLKKYSFFIIIKTFFIVLIFFNVLYCFYDHSVRHRCWQSIDRGIKELKVSVSNRDTQNSVILLFSCCDYCFGILEAFQINEFCKTSPKILYSSDFKVRCEQNIDLRNFLEVRQFGNQFCLKTLDRKKVWFNCEPVPEVFDNAGIEKVLIDEKESDGRVIALSIFIQKKLANLKVMPIFWDEKQKKLILL